MIVGIGTDIVENARFIPWVTAPHTKLRSIFSDHEITDCLTAHTQPNHAAERLAVRFAAKEAFYKALSATLVALDITPTKTFSLIFTAQLVCVVTGQLGVPQFNINWPPFFDKIGQSLPPLTINLSLAHEKNNALAFVVIWK